MLIEEDIMKMYKLTKEEHNEIFKKIKKCMLYKKKPVEHPKAIIDLAPPGSGKTALNSYSKNQFTDENVIIVNGDEIRAMYPDSDKIARKYPEHYAKITDQETMKWTKDLFDFVLENKYNVIFEGTGRTTQILETIKNQMKEYEVSVRGMAVDELNCLLSILLRYREQIKCKGYGRLTTIEAFDRTYLQMLNTIDELEKSECIDSVEIFRRGKIATEPIKIYENDKLERFHSAKEATIIGRIENKAKAKEAYRYYENEILDSYDNSSDFEKKIIDRIISRYKEYQNEEIEK